MIFYVSIRPINFNGKRLLTPRYMLEDGFRGIPILFKCLGGGIKDDGRWLYEIETDTIEHRDVIVEGLSAWGGHLVSTPNKAKELAEKINIPRVFDIDINTNKLNLRYDEALDKRT